MKECEHPSPRTRQSPTGGADIYCPRCKLAVSRRQVDLAWAWMKKIKEMKASFAREGEKP